MTGVMFFLAFNAVATDMLPGVQRHINFPSFSNSQLSGTAEQLLVSVNSITTNMVKFV